MCRHGEGQTQIHAARIPFHRSIQEFLDLRKSDNLIELPFDFSSGHSENGTIQEYIFAPSKFWMKTCAHLQQACHSSLDTHSSLGGLDNPAQNFQERGLSSSVSTDNADNFALPNFE